MRGAPGSVGLRARTRSGSTGLSAAAAGSASPPAGDPSLATVALTIEVCLCLAVGAACGLTLYQRGLGVETVGLLLVWEYGLYRVAAPLLSDLKRAKKCVAPHPTPPHAIHIPFPPLQAVARCLGAPHRSPGAGGCGCACVGLQDAAAQRPGPRRRLLDRPAVPPHRLRRQPADLGPRPRSLLAGRVPEHARHRHHQARAQGERIVRGGLPAAVLCHGVLLWARCVSHTRT